MDYLKQITSIKLPQLKPGAHESPDNGLCAMEMVAYIERLPHSDSPECTCPVIAQYVRSINDRMDDENRQKLYAYLPRLVGTVNFALMQKRAEYLVLHSTKVILAALMEKLGKAEEAQLCKGVQTLKEAGEVARSVRKKAAADDAYAAYAAAADAAYIAYAAYAAAAADADTAVAAAYAVCIRSEFWDFALQALDEVIAMGDENTKLVAVRQEKIVALAV